MRFAVLVVALLAAGGAGAETQYWVSVASHSDLDSAQTEQSRAMERLPEPFSIKPTDTGRNYVYRIVAGPYATQGVAEAVVLEAQRVGYDQAWIVQEEADSYAGESGDSSSAFTESWELTAEQPAVSVAPAEKRETHTLVGEAPPGYELHKLHRTAEPAADSAGNNR